MKTKLPVLCPQMYEGYTMVVTTCTRCEHWKGRACGVYMGCETFPIVDTIPDCPISDRCQHQIQRGERPCVPRERGMVCESALVYAGMDRVEAMEHPDSFSAA